MTLRTIAPLLAALGLMLAACGGQAAPDSELPLNDGDAPSGAAGACLADEPDCDDVGVPAGGGELPPPGDAAITSGALVDGGLSVADALATEATDVIAVQGFLFDDGTGPVLCEALAESFPPQCPGASLPVSGHEEVIGVPLVSEQGVTWTDQTVVLFGEVIDGVLMVDPTVTG